MQARCQCGQLVAEIADSQPAVVACHCLACQRRSGSPFGVLAYYPAQDVTISGQAQRYERRADSGDAFENFFCPVCGSTVYVKTARHPTGVGVPVGAFADPTFAAPIRSVWEQSRHPWVEVTTAAAHLPRGREG